MRLQGSDTMPKDKINVNPELIRTNCRIISSSAEPLYTVSASINNPTMPAVTEDLSSAYNKLGKRFNINTGALTIPNNNYLVTQITIPANWGKTMYVDRVRAGTSSTSIVDFMPATITPSNTLTPMNTHVGSTNATTVTAGYLITTTNPTTAAPLLTYILTGGTYETNFEGRIIIPSTSSIQRYIIRVTNTSTGNTTCMTSFSWYEL